MMTLQSMQTTLGTMTIHDQDIYCMPTFVQTFLMRSNADCSNVVCCVATSALAQLNACPNNQNACWC